MGKMKELWMKMREQEIYNQMNPAPQEPTQTDILCPNCMTTKLHYYSPSDIKCNSGCGQEFVLVDAKTVRFK